MTGADTTTWLRIFRTRGVGPILFHSLLKKYRRPEDAIHYLNYKKFTLPDHDIILKEIEQTVNSGARMIFCADPEYPEILKQAKDAPPFLILKGRVDLLIKPCISIVGSRNASIHGSKIAYDLAKSLSEAGFIIVSGLARGIDRQAHLGAIKNTIAVVANGIDQIYPPENKDIYSQLAQTGTILTEAPFGTPPTQYLFPGRNRIIAGLSIATVVVEATKFSGSLLTAEFALNYGRDVFGVPGCPLDPRSHGPNTLIQNGAYLIQNYLDIINQINLPTIRNNSNSSEMKLTQGKLIEPENSEEEVDSRAAILNCLSQKPACIDEISLHTGIDIGQVRRTLIELEIDGLASCLPGDMVILN